MIQAASFVNQAREMGFRLFTGVPCSYLKPLINYTLDAPGLEYVGAANEGDAVAVAAGAELAGQGAVVLFQNSGFGNAVNPLTSLNATFRIPALLITTWRGEPGGEPDEPQHELMGEITPELFDVLRIRWEFFPQSLADVGPVLARAVEHMDTTRLPYGLIMRKDAVAPHALRPRPAGRPPTFGTLPAASWPAERPARDEVLRRVQAVARPTDAVIATTGYTGRALYALDDRPSQLYLVGSMGCASSVGLGLALAQPQRRVLVLDGDGAALMRLGALATIGARRPSNLVHVLLDNEMHESTGGQATVTPTADLAAVAAACGYPRVLRAATADEAAAALAAAENELTFIHVKTRPEVSQRLPRPEVTPARMAERFRSWLRQTAAEGAAA
jgi:phosphonopyruvate decarboxylase